MITISHLTKAQVELLTMIWNCKSEDEYHSIVSTLPKATQDECYTMLQLIAAELNELRLVNDSDFTLANQVLSKFRK